MSVVAERTMPSVPDERGRFGTYGGRYVPEVLIPALDELAEAWSTLRDDPGFRTEFGDLLRDFVGRPTPITYARRLSEELGYEIWLKREDLAHTGAHKINNALGQALVARRLGKDAHHRGNRRGPARCRGGDGLRLARPAVRGLHGRRGHAPAGAQRRADEAPRRRGRSGDGRYAHAQGSGERGAARLGGERRATPTTSSARSSARTRSRARARPAAGDRRRGARAVPPSVWRLIRTSWWRASAAAATPSACSRRSSAPPGSG